MDCRDGADVRNCTRVFQNVVYFTPEDIPVDCPATGDALGICISECDRNDECSSAGEICCSNRCGRTCLKGIPLTPLCSSIRGLRDLSERLGQFRPSCDTDGSFSEVQCHEGFCWCVDVVSGQPVTEGVRSETPPVCGRCQLPDGDGGLMRVGESYRTSDGCNTWYAIIFRERERSGSRSLSQSEGF